MGGGIIIWTKYNNKIMKNKIIIIPITNKHKQKEQYKYEKQ